MTYYTAWNLLVMLTKIKRTKEYLNITYDTNFYYLVKLCNLYIHTGQALVHCANIPSPLLRAAQDT